MSLFRIVRPLFRPQVVPDLQRPGLPCTFFQSSSPMGLNTRTPRFPAPQSIFQRLYASAPKRKNASTQKTALFTTKKPPPSRPKQQPVRSQAPEPNQEHILDEIAWRQADYWEKQEMWKTYMLYGFIAINVAVFLYLNYLRIQASQNRDPRDFFAAMQNATTSLRGVLEEHRYWTLITSMFAHISPGHIGGNMIAFYFMGRLLAQTPGVTAKAFATLVLGAGISGDVAYLIHRSREANDELRNRPSLGFSGAVSAITTVGAIMWPRQKVLLMMIIPMPLWLVAGGFLVYDGFLMSSEDRVAHSGHLGGALFGVVFYFLRLRAPFLKILGGVLRR